MNRYDRFTHTNLFVERALQTAFKWSRFWRHLDDFLLELIKYTWTTLALFFNEL